MNRRHYTCALFLATKRHCKLMRGKCEIGRISKCILFPDEIF
jgi:hypothetical protein